MLIGLLAACEPATLQPVEVTSTPTTPLSETTSASSEPEIYRERRLEMEASELALLLEGIDLRGARRRPQWTPTLVEKST